MVELSRGMQYAKYTSNYLCIKCTFLNFSKSANCTLVHLFLFLLQPSEKKAVYKYRGI